MYLYMNVPSRPNTPKPQSKRQGISRKLKFRQSMRNDESKRSIRSQEKEWMQRAEGIIYNFYDIPSDDVLRKILKYKMLKMGNVASAILLRKTEKDKIKILRKQIEKDNNSFLNLLKRIKEKTRNEIFDDDEEYGGNAIDDINVSLKYYQKKNIMKMGDENKMLDKIIDYIEENTSQGRGKKRKTKRKRKRKRKRRTKRRTKRRR